MGMAISRERFESGMTYDEYKAQMTRNKEQFEANERNLQLSSEDLTTFKSLPDTINVLVLAEDWCGDVIANLPILGRIARECGKLNLKVLLKDQNMDIMKAYLLRGEFESIPLALFLDANFKEIGLFQERPDSVTAHRAGLSAEIFRAHPEFGAPGTPLDKIPESIRPQYQALTAQMRVDTQPFANAEVVKVIKNIVVGAAAAA